MLAADLLELINTLGAIPGNTSFKLKVYPGIYECIRSYLTAIKE
jgi:hypothetical protein